MTVNRDGRSELQVTSEAEAVGRCRMVQSGSGGPVAHVDTDWRVRGALAISLLT